MRRLSFSLLAAAALASGCAHQLAPVRPVAPELPPEPTAVWPAYVTADDRALLEDAERRVEDVRKGELLVNVRDAEGLPVRLPLDVRWRQVSHDFRFGVHAVFDPAVWGPLLRAGVNHGAVSVDWASTEPQADTWTTEAVAAAYGLGVLPDMGVSMRATAALWMRPEHTPEAILALRDKEAVFRAVDRHVRGLVQRLHGDVVLWDALRDPDAAWSRALGGSDAALVRLAATAVSAVRAVDNVVPIGVSLADPMGIEHPDRLAPLAFTKRLQDAGGSLDVISLEYYYNGHLRDADATPLARATLSELADNLRSFAAFGPGLHIGGVSVPSEPHPDADRAGYWGRPWSEDLQAVYLRAFYTLAFADEAVRAVVWRDAVDSGAYVDHGGLFRRAGAPKPSFYALGDLISSWTTRAGGTTDDEGRLRLRGFGGMYVLDVICPTTGERLTRTATIRERELDTLTIDLPASWSADLKPQG